ncbi:MAG: alpha/beta hydrolase-fold protein, partial [bacterium]
MKLLIAAAFIFCNWACGEKIASSDDQFVTDKVDGRSLQIYLPPSYQTSDKRYPVVYIHDGQQ